jgi:hypothetical protein
MENSIEISQGIKSRITDLAIPLLDIEPKAIKSLFPKTYLHFHVHYSVIHHNQALETTCVYRPMN